MSPKLKVLLGVTLGFLALDQATKHWVSANLVEGRDEIVVIPKFLSIVHAKNTGAAFSSFGDFEYRFVLFGVFTVIAVFFLLQTWWQLPADDRMQSAAVGLILSGAVGNGIDRLLYREVTDFVRTYGGWEPVHSWLVDRFRTDTWPIWNVADATILIGVGVFVLHYLIVKDKDEGPVEGSAPNTD